MNKKTWTIGELVEWTTAHFQEKGIPEPRINVEWLLSQTLTLRRFDLYVNFDRPLTPSELAAFKSLVQRRLKREPLQYIVGSAEFMGLSFQVRKGVLIPRPETEFLVDAVLSFCQSYTGVLKILDVGVGSGCIAVSVAHYLAKKNITAEITGLDISKTAIEIARINAERLTPDASVTLIEGDLALVKSMEDLGGPFDVIVSNPPYIPTAELSELQPEVTGFEPREALDGGATGLDFYRRLALVAPAWLRPSSRSAILLEAGFDQGVEIERLLVQQGFAVKKIKDYNSVDRVILGSLNAS